MSRSRRARDRGDNASRSVSEVWAEDTSEHVPAGTSPPPDAHEPARESPATQLTRTLKGVGSIVAPITLITALMYYFGLQHAHWYFRYFGINHTVMGLTTQDYLLRSADGLFVPLTAAAALILVLLWLYRLVKGRLVESSKAAAVRRVAAVAAAVLGTVGLATAIVGLFSPEHFLFAPAVPGLCLSAGALLLALSSNLHWLIRTDGRTATQGWVGIAEWGALFVVAGIGLFWAVTNYSAAVGETRAYRTALELAGEAEVLMYSKDRLSMPTATAREIVCPLLPERSEAAYEYRYEGLKLVLATDSAYFLLPSDWPAGGGIAIVLPRTESVRMEFMRQDLAEEATC